MAVVASRSLSAFTLANASAFATSSFLIGICAAMPPIAWMLRRWHVDQELRVTLHEVCGHRHQCAVGETEVALVPNFLMHEKM
jgi:hypothetical protein